MPTSSKLARPVVGFRWAADRAAMKGDRAELMAPWDSIPCIVHYARDSSGAASGCMRQERTLACRHATLVEGRNGYGLRSRCRDLAPPGRGHGAQARPAARPSAAMVCSSRIARRISGRRRGLDVAKCALRS